MFGKILKAMAGGVALSKFLDALLAKSEKEKAMEKFKENLKKAEKEAKERMKTLPKDDQDYIYEMIGEKPRKK